MKHVALMVFIGLMGAGSVCPAWATLGEQEGSVATDAAHFKSSMTSNGAGHSALFRVQRMTLPNSTQIDEYISASGVVFAVNWRGPRPPDLRQLFGSYFPEYQAAALRPAARSSQMQIDTGRMTYHVGGHMRAYRGSARIPALLPAGVTAADLQ